MLAYSANKFQNRRMSKITVATQGQEASFHYEAVTRFFPTDEVEILGFDSFEATFGALASGHAEYAVSAVENSIHGAINIAYDLMDQPEMWICGEVYLHIEQCLIALPGTKLADITDVYSHFAALSQTRHYLDQHLPHADRHVHPDTGGAVADIKQWNQPHKAAIASAYAAEHYNLPILAANIETDPHNYTRFALLSRKRTVPETASKTTLLLQLQSHPGALHAALGIFAAHQLDLTTLVSRPVVGKPGIYQFFIDLNISANAPAFQQAVQEITATGDVIHVLGSYTPLNSLAQVSTK